MKGLRHWLEAAALWMLFILFRCLRAETASSLGGWIGGQIGPRLAASRKALRNLQHAYPDNDPERNARIVTDMWNNLGRIVGEYPHLRKIIRDNVEIIGEENLRAIGKDKPLVVMAAHLGNWELGPFYFNHRIEWPLAGIYRAPNNPYVERLLDACRNPESKGIFIPKSQRGVRDMMRVLQEGGRLGNLIDQKYNQGLPVSFFGRPAMTSPAFIQLAKKYDCPILPLRVERTHGCQFRITLYPAFSPHDGDERAILERCHRMLEEWINDRPGQWLWLHRRWDSTALGQREN